MKSFIIEIASVPDREKLVAEIWFSEILIAEINQEKERLEIDFFISERISFDTDEFIEALLIAKKKLGSVSI